MKKNRARCRVDCLILIAETDDDGRRLDRVLRKALSDMPLSAIHRQLRKGEIKINGKKTSPSYLVKKGDEIAVNAGHEIRKEKETKRNSTFKLDILYEGEGILAVNKPVGINVHGKNSLDDSVRSYLEQKLSPSLSFKPGPLHRLDRGSSGVIVFSSSLEGAREFSRLLREKKIMKYYLAVVLGEIKKEDIWEDDLSRREKPETARIAITRVKPLAAAGGCTLVLAEIETGRTHQIRAQAAFHGYPLLGDSQYGAKPGNKISRKTNSLQESNESFHLHALRLEIPKEILSKNGTPNNEKLIVEAPLPESFRKKILEIFGKISCNQAFPIVI